MCKGHNSLSRQILRDFIKGLLRKFCYSFENLHSLYHLFLIFLKCINLSMIDTQCYPRSGVQLNDLTSLCIMLCSTSVLLPSLPLHPYYNIINYISMLCFLFL